MTTRMGIARLVSTYTPPDSLTREFNYLTLLDSRIVLYFALRRQMWQLRGDFATSLITDRYDTGCQKNQRYASIVK